jgi:hypothetical protein
MEEQFEEEKPNILQRFLAMKLWIKLVSLGLPLLVIASVVAIALVPKPDETYLTSLREHKLGGYYASDAAAIAKGKAVCAGLQAGGANQGLEVESLAVKVYCPDFYSGYRVLKQIKVEGEFSLADYSPSEWYPSISNIGSWCWGSNGYSDIDEGTSVVITNQDGTRLAETSLEKGHGGAYYCTFKFHFTVMEGEKEYMVAVSHRGQTTYTEAKLKLPGSVSLILN